MSASMPMEGPKADVPLADPELRRFLRDFVKRRVGEADADDIVQTVFVEALTSKNLPSDREEMRKYLLGIARHKVVDIHRRTSREMVGEPPELHASPPPIEEDSLARWAERQAPPTEEAKKTLAWMAREGEGEKLENIAEEEKVPAARVRQRVSRMRRWMKERWLAELAAVAALVVVSFVLWRLLRKPDDVEAIKPDWSAHPPVESPLDRARSLRAEALRQCDTGNFRLCIDGLDEAKKLDEVGDRAPEVQAARDRAKRALELLDLGPKSPPVAPPPKSIAPKELDEKPDLKKVESKTPRTTSTEFAPKPKAPPPKKVQKEKPAPSTALDFQKTSPSSKKRQTTFPDKK